MDKRPIAFFDSGIGGSTILKEVINTLPNENYIYYPDSKNNPYGNKTKEELFSIVDNIVQELLKYNPKLIVCACNTATTMVLKDIREKYKDIIFIGTEPAIKVAYDFYRDKKTIILTTKGTGDSDRFNDLLEKYKVSNFNLIEAPLLAGFIEKNEDCSDYLNNLLGVYKDTEVVVLGCTHFPIVKDEIKNVLGDVTFIDGSIGIAKRIDSILKEKNMYNNSYKLDIINTDEEIRNRILNIIKAR